MAIIKVRNPAIDLDAAEIPNLDASKITTGFFDASRIGSGTFADARIAASNVSQHATSFDDNKIVNDISTLALRQASDQNKSAYNTNSQSVDVFQDATGIDTTTNAQRNASEYVSSSTSSVGEFSNDNDTVSLMHFNNSSSDENSGVTWSNTNVTYSNSIKKFGSHSGSFNGSAKLTNSSANTHFHTTGDLTVEAWFYLNNLNSNNQIFEIVSSTTQSLLFGYLLNPDAKYGSYMTINSGGWSISGNDYNTGNNTISAQTWQHLALTRQSGTTRLYLDGVQKASTTTSWSFNAGDSDANIGGFRHDQMNGYIDEFRWSSVCRYPDGTTFTPNSVTTVSATGNFTGTTITAPSSVSSMGAIITYQDNAGTNALNTDIVLQLSADGGSNYSTATLTALPDFSTGIKMAKVNDLAVTAGTSLKYKISFANQASGTKEARIRGVALQY